jgi:hypothetical protein
MMSLMRTPHAIVTVTGESTWLSRCGRDELNHEGKFCSMVPTPCGQGLIAGAGGFVDSDGMGLVREGNARETTPDRRLGR